MIKVYLTESLNENVVYMTRNKWTFSCFQALIKKAIINIVSWTKGGCYVSNWAILPDTNYSADLGQNQFIK